MPPAQAIETGWWVAAGLGLAAVAFLVARAPRESAEPGPAEGLLLFFLGIAIYLFFGSAWFVKSWQVERPALFFIAAAAVKGAGAVLAVIVARAQSRGGDPLLLRRPSSWRTVGWSLALYLCLAPAVMVLARYTTGGEEPAQESARMLVSSGLVVRIAMFPFLVLATPIFEELVFRGLFQGSLRRVMPPSAAIVLGALLFGMVHDPKIFPSVLILGLALGWVYERTRTLWAPTAIHVLHNAFAYILFLSPE